MKTTEILRNVLQVFFKKELKIKGWDGELRIRLAFGRRRSKDEPMAEDDLEEGTEEYLFSQSVPDSPAAKTSAQDKRKESHIDPLDLRAFFQQIYDDPTEGNDFYHGMTVQMSNKLEMAVLSGRGYLNKCVREHLTNCLRDHKFSDCLKLIPFFCSEHVKLA